MLVKLKQYIFNFLSRYFIMTSLSPMPIVTPVSATPFVISGSTKDALNNDVITASGLSFPVVLPASVSNAVSTDDLLFRITNSDGNIVYSVGTPSVAPVSEVGFFVALPQFEAGATIESVVTGTQYTNAASTSVTFPEIEGQWIVVTPAPVVSASSVSGSSVAA